MELKKFRTPIDAEYISGIIVCEWCNYPSERERADERVQPEKDREEETLELKVTTEREG